MRRTKIICTLGPATDDEAVLRELFLNGMNVARLNFSHGSHDEHKARFDSFKKIREELNYPVGLLLDTKGPEIRIKTFKNGKIKLKAGQEFNFVSKDIVGDEKNVSITYKNLYKDVCVGDKILIDDGLIELDIIEKNNKRIKCKVFNDGIVSDRKSINIPGVSVKLPYMSEKDKEDIIFGIKNDVDFIAASFVRNASDLKTLKQFLEDHGGCDIRIIAKIENREGVNNVDEIIRLSDGIMVARGDMGVEIAIEELPSVQKQLITKCNLAGKTVITATQMLDSMINNPRPTRAEITDVANAIYDGTSAIMLSGETSIGKYPLIVVQTMSKIANRTEKEIHYEKRFNNSFHMNFSEGVTNAISHATCSTAHSLGASTIISVTKSGYTARMVSKYRPACNIISATIDRKIFNQLAVTWGVIPLMVELKVTTEEIFDHAVEVALKGNFVKNGDLVVITGGMPSGISGTTNVLKAHIVGDVLMRGNGVNKLKATGSIFVVHDEEKAIQEFNYGDIIVLSKTTSKILPLLKNASAIITEEDENDSKAVTVGLALEIPIIANAEGATSTLKGGTIVTVKAGEGIVYKGSK